MWLLAVQAALANPYAVEATVVEEDPLAWEVPMARVVAGEAGEVQLVLHVPAGAVAYRDRIAVQVGETEVHVGRAVVPAAPIGSRGSGRTEDRERFDADVVIRLPLRVADAGLFRVPLTLTHQGCARGLCYPERTTQVELLVVASS